MNILGISAFYHDSAACLLKDGEIIAAAEEERFTRIKHDQSFPKNAIQYCLTRGKITGEELDYVAFYDKPFIKFDRILETYLQYAPFGLKSFMMAIPLWIRQKLLLYSAFTYFLGFKVNSGGYKVMGLAPYGEPKYVQKIYSQKLRSEKWIGFVM